MSDLTGKDRRRLERLLRMESGYVLNFSNRTFSDFFDEHTGNDIDAIPYEAAGTSKANRLRTFWDIESNASVGRLIAALIDYAHEIQYLRDEDATLVQDCQAIADRLLQGTETLVVELDAISATTDDQDFSTVAKQARDAIERNEPAAGIDRLHTFTLKFIRTLCAKHGLPTSREKPLHSSIGEYVKWLQDNGHIEAKMTVRLLKSNISVLEAFNDVRNSQSMSHDNQVLNDEEALLIYNQVCSVVRFVKALEASIDRRKKAAMAPSLEDDIPF